MVSSFNFKSTLGTTTANCDADPKHLIITVRRALTHVEAVGDVSDAQTTFDMFNTSIKKVNLPCFH